MFSRNKNKLPAGTQVRTVPSIISSDLKVKGDLVSDGEIQVDGQVSGDIHAKVLLVGQNAKITGEIFAETVRVHGNVNGQIKAKFVNLAKTAHVIGDIHHENLSIQEGAFLEGHMVHMNEQEVEDAVPTETQTAPAQTNTIATNGKPAEDRVNLVVKSGKQVQQNKPTAPAQGNQQAQAAKVAAGK